MARRLRPFTPASVPAVPLEVRDVVAFPAFAGARLVAGARGAAGQILRVNVMQIPTAEFARPHELVLATTTAFEGAPGALEQLIRELADRGVAALAAHRQALDRLGERAFAVADDRRLPLIELPVHARLNVVLRQVLERLVAKQTTQLEDDRRVRELLADLALAGSGIDALPGVIGELTGGAVTVVDEHGCVLAASDEERAAQAEQIAHAWLDAGWNEPAEAGGGWIAWPIRGSGRRLGCLVASIPGEPLPIHRAILEHGSTSAALGILQIQAAAAETNRLREQFIHDLLGGSFEPDAVRDRTGLLGWNPDDAYRVLLARGEQGGAAALLAHTRERLPAAPAVEHQGACLAIVGSLSDGDPEADAAVASLAHALAADDGSVRVGVSGRHAGMADLAVAAREAAEMLAAATSFASRPARWFDPMDPLRVLALVRREELAAFADHVLGPLDELHDERRRTLLETLEVLVETDLNVAATARRGGWHYNTVRYRIGRLTELVGPFVESGERLQSLTLALLIRRELVD